MTNKGRVRNCEVCGNQFIEHRSDSNKQWEARRFCSMRCNNSSKHRVTDIYERFDRHVERRQGCWAWNGSKDDKGYGKLSNRNGANASPERAHRVSYEKYVGKIPEGYLVCHKCDNPECTNPEHLFVGSQKDNMQDCARKGRISTAGKKYLIPGALGYRGAAIPKNKVNKS